MESHSNQPPPSHPPLTAAADFFTRHAAVIALAVFAVVGVAVLDDYGFSFDGTDQRTIGVSSFRYILGNEDALIEGHHNRFYGVAFEVPLIAVERLLRLEDSRDIFLVRHLLTHALFLAGGFFAWLLAYRLFGSRLVALLAMLIFLLHPRMYAHSFFNSKDLPFLSVFMIALYLTHRAFRRDSARAFALCGAGAALLVNIRVMGLMLPPAVLGMLALDAVRAARREGRGDVKRAIANAAAFFSAFAATFYATAPPLWRDPLSVIEGIATLSRHPSISPALFRGEVVRWPDIPWDYIPTWMLITTPPVALALAAVGIAYLARLCAADWRDALANSTARFGLLALVCLTLPVAAAVALNSNLYSGWRHMYFLYAPLCVLAAFGLRALAALPNPRLRAGAFALAALGLAAVAVQMVRIHPYQNDYFNPLADKSGLANRWQMDYWRVSYREALEALLEIQPTGRIDVSAHEIHLSQNRGLIPADERRRLNVNLSFPSFRIVSGDGGDAAIWKREIYGVPIVSILDTRAESAAALPAAYESARATEPAASVGGFDIYADGDTLIYIKEACGEKDRRSRFELAAFPVDPNDMSEVTRRAGLEYKPLDLSFRKYGAALDGGCVIVRDLPDYPIIHVETGQWKPDMSGLSWIVKIRLDGYLEMFRRALATLPDKQPAARSGFDIWLNDRTLTYLKENCAEEDTRGRFFLSIFPTNQTDLTQTARAAGHEHEPLNFDFPQYGEILADKCAIIRELPDYPINRIQTGQWIPGEGELWSAEIAVGD